MPNEYTNDGIFIAPVILDHLNGWSEKTCYIGFETFLSSFPSMKLQQISEAEIERSYTDGGYVASWPFAVYIRIKSCDTKSSLSAVETLNSLTDYLRSGAPPVLSGNKLVIEISLTSLPSLSGSYNDGMMEYRVDYRLRYEQS